MDNLTEPSSSMSFTSSSKSSTSSSYLSNASTSQNESSFTAPEAGSNLELVSLNKLSNNLEQLLGETGVDYSDAEIVVEGIHLGVHQCILAVRSKYFHEVFSKGKETAQEAGSKPKYCMTDLVPYGNVGYEAFMIVLSYLYTGKLKPYPKDVSTCVDCFCIHDACRPAISFEVELMYASANFQIPELVSLFQRRLLNFVEKAFVEDVIPILLVGSHCQLNQIFVQCLHRIARSDIDDISLEKELPQEVNEKIKMLRLKSQPNDESDEVDPVQEKRIRRIHKALDSDDVKLVEMLLSESDLTLDDAYALHYAAAYCDPKVVNEVLDMGLADVNLRNSRGYTAIHVAAMRKEPSVVVSLLNKGVSAYETTVDNQNPVTICRRLTRPKDYNAKTKRGQESNKARMCIDVLEGETQRNTMSWELFATSLEKVDDLHMQLLYLENRDILSHDEHSKTLVYVTVAFARLLFPTEAKLVMEIAHAFETSQFVGTSGLITCSNSKGVDLDETPEVRNKRLNLRKVALLKTVELGHRYFHQCSKVLDDFMGDDHFYLFILEKGTPDEQRIKRARFMELKEDVEKAFNKEKAQLRRTGFLPSSSSKDGEHDH